MLRYLLTMGRSCTAELQNYSSLIDETFYPLSNISHCPLPSDGILEIQKCAAFHTISVCMAHLGGLVKWRLIWQVWGGAWESAFLMSSEEVLMMLAPGTHWATTSQRILHCPRLKEATLVADIQNQYIQPISHWFQSILGQFLNALNIPCSWRKHLATRKLWILLSVLEAPVITNKYH